MQVNGEITTLVVVLKLMAVCHLQRRLLVSFLMIFMLVLRIVQIAKEKVEKVKAKAKAKVISRKTIPGRLMDVDVND